MNICESSLYYLTAQYSFNIFLMSISFHTRAYWIPVFNIFLCPITSSHFSLPILFWVSDILSVNPIFPWTFIHSFMSNIYIDSHLLINSGWHSISALFLLLLSYSSPHPTTFHQFLSVSDSINLLPSVLLFQGFF